MSTDDDAATTVPPGSRKGGPVENAFRWIVTLVQHAIASEVSTRLAAEINDRLGAVAVQPADLHGVVRPSCNRRRFAPCGRSSC